MWLGVSNSPLSCEPSRSKKLAVFVSDQIYPSFRIDTPLYLQYLHDQFVSKGGTVLRAHLANLTEVSKVVPPAFSEPVAILNCTGIGAREFVGDVNVFPTRGQTVLVRAPWVKDAMTRKGAGGVYT